MRSASNNITEQEIDKGYNSLGMYTSAFRKSCCFNEQNHEGYQVQEMVDPDRVKGCYFTMEHTPGKKNDLN